MASDRRNYTRITAEAGLRFEQEPTEQKTRKYMDAVAGNVGLGGVFIATELVFRKGSILKLSLTIGEDKINARGIVRWVEKRNRPRGMGVEFIEFDGVDKETFTKWLQMQ